MYYAQGSSRALIHSSPKAPKNFNTQAFKYEEKIQSIHEEYKKREERETSKQAYDIDVRLRVPKSPRIKITFKEKNKRNNLFFIFFAKNIYQRDCILLF